MPPAAPRALLVTRDDGDPARVALQVAGFVVEQISTVASLADLAGSWDVVVCDRSSAKILLATQLAVAIIVSDPSIDSDAGVALIRAGVRDVITSPGDLPVAIERHARDLRERAGVRRALIEEIAHDLNSPLGAVVLGLEFAAEEIAALGHHDDVAQPLDRTRAREIESLVSDAARAGDRLCAVVAELRERKLAEVSALLGHERRGRILIVDDEPALARVLCRILGAHDITIASDGRAALSYIANGERFDVILCDLMMPNMNGMELHDALLHAAPEQISKVAFMTGGAPTAQAREFLRKIPNPQLDKPCRAVHVRSLVASLLGG